MANRQTLPLTEQEIKSVYRNDFFRIDEKQYFKNPSINKKAKDKKKGTNMDKFYGKIKLNSISDVKNFVSAANEIPCDVVVSSGMYIVDGKSILGLFSLDLSKDVMLNVDKTYIDNFLEWIDE